MRLIKAEDCSTGYKKSAFGGYRPLILDDKGNVIWKAKKKKKTAKLAKEFADRVLSMNAVMTVEDGTDK